ncbi:hypothetical protein GIB67_005021 [Kingdonia uniflora]|uniref:Transposase Tnp1/En/Spm-like domain-containing protein n=1 Tax=Kingdonia uniflora TaxID=39325 RepID=A0A7J7NMQ0_9MAGN|nr:hypothetical protein GIB67_005021 [Kingdonia uniflora]
MDDSGNNIGNTVLPDNGHMINPILEGGAANISSEYQEPSEDDSTAELKKYELEAMTALYPGCEGQGNSNILTKLEKSLDGSLSAPPDLLNVVDYNENDDEGRPVGSNQEFIIEEGHHITLIDTKSIVSTGSCFLPKITKQQNNIRIAGSDHMDNEPFIAAEHAIQVFYSQDPKDPDWHVVLQVPSKVYVDDEACLLSDERVLFDSDIGPFSFIDHTTHSLNFDSAVVDTARNIPSHTSSSRRRGPSRGSKPLPDGKKKKVGVNSWGQPIRGVNSYSTTVRTLTCNHIPINFKKFTNVLDEFIHIVKTELELTFVLRRVVNFSILRRINDAWKRHKSRLNKKYIKGKDPTKVKATPPPFVLKEVWVEFVDMRNSDAFQAQSKKNMENCNKVKAPYTTGRTSMAVVHPNLAVEGNAPDEDVCRADVFIKAHTKAKKTYQCPKIINMNLYPDSNKIGHDDVLAKTLSKDKKGHMMAMGIDITPSFVANAIHIVEENEDLKAINNELNTMLLNTEKNLDDHIKKTSGVPQIQPSSSYNAPSNSSEATQRKQSDLNRECKLNGYPEGIVAYGIVADVSPDAFCHNKQLGDGYYKIKIFNVINEDALLFRQDSFTKTMRDVGAGGFVAWPKSFTIFTS